MKVFILTLQFLTRIPLNFQMDIDEDDFAKGVVYFPIAGLIIGAFNLLIYYLSGFILDGIFPAVCYVLANVVITGALHLDGIADTCDGIFSSRTRERMLEIMKDSRIGTNGTIAVLLDVLLRAAVLFGAPKGAAYVAILAAPVISRTMLIVIMQVSRYARENGMGGLFLGKQAPVRTLIGFVIGLGLTFAIGGYLCLTVFFAALAAAFLFRWYIYGKLGGMTGDTVGATNEVVEIVALILIITAWRYGVLC